jgi:hypothetical protein
VSHKGHLTILIHPKYTSLEKITVRQWKTPSVDIQYSYNAETNTFQVLASPHNQPIIFLLQGIQCPSAVINKIRYEPLPLHSKKLDLDQSSYGYYCDGSKKQLFIRNGPANDKDGLFVEIPNLKTLYNAN